MICQVIRGSGAGTVIAASCAAAMIDSIGWWAGCGMVFSAALVLSGGMSRQRYFAHLAFRCGLLSTTHPTRKSTSPLTMQTRQR